MKTIDDGSGPSMTVKIHQDGSGHIKNGQEWIRKGKISFKLVSEHIEALKKPT